MDFIIELLNNIYNMIKSILASAGVNTDGFPEDLIPTTQAAE